MLSGRVDQTRASPAKGSSSGKAGGPAVTSSQTSVIPRKGMTLQISGIGNGLEHRQLHHARLKRDRPHGFTAVAMDGGELGRGIAAPKLRCAR